MSRAYHSRIYTVQGVTANLKQLAAHFGVGYPLAHTRKFRREWTLEQALGLEPPPRGRGQQVHRHYEGLVSGPALAPADENFLRAHFQLITAEEYLRLEGVPMNGYPLEARNEF
jgi:hypothetical protein